MATRHGEVRFHSSRRRTFLLVLLIILPMVVSGATFGLGAAAAGAGQKSFVVRSTGLAESTTRLPAAAPGTGLLQGLSPAPSKTSLGSTDSQREHRPIQPGLNPAPPTTRPTVASENGSDHEVGCTPYAGYNQCFNIPVYASSLLVVDFTQPAYPGGYVSTPIGAHVYRDDFNTLFLVSIPANSSWGSRSSNFQFYYYEEYIGTWVAFDITAGILDGVPHWTYGPAVPSCPATDCTWTWNATTPMSGTQDAIAVVLPSIYFTPVLINNCPIITGEQLIWSVAGYNCGNVNSVTVTGLYENVTNQFNGSLVADFLAPQTTWEQYGTEYHSPEGYSFLVCGGTLNTVTFTERGLPAGDSWSVDFGGDVQPSTTTTDVFTACQGGTAWSIPHYFGYSESPTSGSVNVQGANLNVNLTFSPYNDVEVKAQYVGDYISGASLANTIGVYAANGSQAAMSVSGVLDGHTYTFGQIVSGTQIPWNLSLNMQAVATSGTFVVTVNYTSTQKFVVDYNVTILKLPTWLQSLVSVSEYSSTTLQGTAEWSNTFQYGLNYALPITTLFGFNMSLPLLGSGSYSWLPDFDLTFGFNSSTSTATLTGDFSYTSPGLEFDGFGAPLTANLTVKLTMTGSVSVNPLTSTIKWTKSTAQLEFGVDFDIVIPIAGWSFSLFGQTYDVGLTLEIDVAPAYDITLVFTPAAAGKGTIGGLDITITPTASAIDIPITITLKLGTNQLASLEAGGTLDFNFQLSGSPPFISSATVSGSVFIGGCLLGACATVTYNVDATNLSPSVFAAGFEKLANFTYQSRYYNTSSYELHSWSTGAFNGTAVENVYPHAVPSEVGVGTTSYWAWGYDNVSLPQSKSEALAGVSLASSSRTLQNFSLPKTSGTLAGNPVLGPYGSNLVAFWDSTPTGALNKTNPFNSTKFTLDEATYTPSTGVWSKTTKWLNWSDPESYQLSKVGSDTRLLVLVAHSFLSPVAQLVEYDVENDTVLFNESVSNVYGISAFNAQSNIAVFELFNGATELWSIAADSQPYVPTVSGAVLESASLANSSIEGLWFQGEVTNEYIVFNTTTDQPLATIPLGASVSAAVLVASGNQLYLVTVRNHQLSTLEVETPTVWVPIGPSYEDSNVTQLSALVISRDMVVSTDQVFGNSSRPQFNFGVSITPLATPQTPKLTAVMVGANEVHFSWTLSNSKAYGVSGFNLLSGSTPNPSWILHTFPSSQTSWNFTDNDSTNTPWTFAIEAENAFGIGSPSKTVYVYTVIFDAANLKSGNWTATFGGYSLKSNQTNQTFDAVNGSYSYSITPTTGSAVGLSTGSISVSGFSMYQAETMAATGTHFYTVKFNETGLASGSYWQVNLSAVTQSAITSTLSIYLPNGTYAYKIYAPGYSATPSSGSAKVKGVTLKISVAFAHLPALPASAKVRLPTYVPDIAYAFPSNNGSFANALPPVPLIAVIGRVGSARDGNHGL